MSVSVHVNNARLNNIYLIKLEYIVWMSAKKSLEQMEGFFCGTSGDASKVFKITHNAKWEEN